MHPAVENLSLRSCWKLQHTQNSHYYGAEQFIVLSSGMSVCLSSLLRGTRLAVYFTALTGSNFPATELHPVSPNNHLPHPGASAK
jgi:hypothetical protein